MRRCSGEIGVCLPAALALAFVSGVNVGGARAQSTDLDVSEREICLRDGVTRVLELREGPDGGLPCQVVYLMPDEGGSSWVMWLARHDRGFCSTRFDSFLVKLETKLAWQCESQAVPDAPDVQGNGEDVPDLARAAPEPMSRAVAERMSALRDLMPSGAYRLVSAGETSEPTGANDGSCPPGGSFFWNTRDPDRPVFRMGLTAELPVRLATELDDEAPAGVDEPEGERGASSGNDAPGVRTFALDGARSDGRGRTIELRVRSSEEGDTEPGQLCRYAPGS